MPVAFGARRDAGDAVLKHDAFAQRQHGVGHGDIDELPAAGALRAPAGRCDPEREEHARDDVANARPDLGRRAARDRPGDAHDAAHGLRDGIVGRPLGIGAEPGARIAEAAQGRVHELGVALGERLVGQPEPLHDAGAEVLHDDVGPIQQAQQRGLAFGRLQVEDDRFLVAVDRGEVGAIATLLDAQRAFGVRARLAGVSRRRAVPP